jgi:hypothetical protein
MKSFGGIKILAATALLSVSLLGGHWGAGRPGYHWAPHAWVRYGGGWRMAPGHWAHR